MLQESKVTNKRLKLNCQTFNVVKKTFVVIN